MKARIDRLLRRLVPSMPLLARRRLLVPIFELPDRLMRAFIPEFRRLPPNRLRLRVGVGNKVFFNQVRFLETGYQAATRLFAAGLAGVDSRMTEIGSGCGRLPLALQGLRDFRGQYVGLDVDAEMIEWCARNLADAQYRFIHADVYSSVYNPGGSKEAYTLPLPDSTQDLVVSYSLFTHLLDAELGRYMTESDRVLDTAGRMSMSVHCIEDMASAGALGGRWTFEHRMGPAYIQDPRYPEAAVAYEREYLVDRALAAGFRNAEVISFDERNGQSALIAQK